MDIINVHSTDDKNIPLYTNESDSDIHILLIPDIFDSSDRYFNILNELKSMHISASIFDIRGHNKALNSLSAKLHFSDYNGWNLVIDDINSVVKYTKENNKNKKIYLFGLGTGSDMIRTYIYKYGVNITGAILYGTSPYLSYIKYSFLDLLINIIINFKGRDYRSKLLYKLFFKIDSNPKNFSGLLNFSKDIAEVEKYFRNPLTGGLPSAVLYKDLLIGRMKIQDKLNLSYIPENMKLLFLAGTKDPSIGSKSKQKSIVDFYRSKNIKSDLIFIENAMHDPFHDVEKNIIYDIIRGFINDTK